MKRIDIAAGRLYYRENGVLTDFPGADAISNDDLVTCDAMCDPSGHGEYHHRDVARM